MENMNIKIAIEIENQLVVSRLNN